MTNENNRLRKPAGDCDEWGGERLIDRQADVRGILSMNGHCFRHSSVVFRYTYIPSSSTRSMRYYSTVGTCVGTYVG